MKVEREKKISRVNKLWANHVRYRTHRPEDKFENINENIEERFS